MKANIFSVLMTILWSSVLYCKIGSVRVYEILFSIWIIGILCSLTRYFIQYRRAIRYFQELPQEESRHGQEFIDGLDRSGRIKVLQSSGLTSPCCAGIFQKRIFLPAKAYGREELQYILLHEYTHLAHHDILLKLLVRVLCGIYWWNPLVYCLKKGLNQSMEIRCDLSVTGNLKEKERADYLDLMLETFCESALPDQAAGIAGLAEERSKSLLERFRIVADRGIVQEKRVNAFAGAVMLLVLILSYSFILQSSYETPLSEIETGPGAYSADPETSWIIKRGDTYSLCTPKIEHPINEDTARRLMEEVGFPLKEVMSE